MQQQPNQFVGTTSSSTSSHCGYYLTKDVTTETCAFLDSGSDNTQITNSMAEALGIKDTDHIAVPISSLYGKHIITSYKFLLGNGSLNSTGPLFILPVYATSASEFQMQKVSFKMLNSIWAD